jgi:hypothetical protein
MQAPPSNLCSLFKGWKQKYPPAPKPRANPIFPPANPTSLHPPTTPFPPPSSSPTMNGEDPQERPEQIRNIINGLERYNPQAAEVLEAYLVQQCEQKFCDCNANRALLKL